MGFSIYGNLEKLFNVEKIEGQLDCLHSIRFLSMSWVVLGHFFNDIIGLPNELRSFASKYLQSIKLRFPFF